MSRIENITKELQALKKKEVHPVSGEKVDIKKIKKDGTLDRRVLNGGKGPIGRKPLEQDEKRKNLKRSWEDFAQEITEIKELDKGTREVRKVKMQRLRVVQEKLFKGVLAGDVAAIREFNNRVHGHPKQPIVGDDDEAPVQVELGVERILDKTYGTERRED